jgi:SPP1 family phage portal protein
MKSYINEYLELPEPIHLSEDTEITPDLIKVLIDHHSKSLHRYEVLQNYYKGKTIIFDRKKDDHKANNKLVFDYAGYIIDVLQGLFVGKPISYTPAEGAEKYMEEMQKILDANDEQDENTELAKMMGINGRGYEIVYVNENKEICFNEIKPQNMIFVYDNKIKPEPLFAVYLPDADTVGENKKQFIYAYTKKENIVYSTENGGMVEIERTPNIFGEVPVIEFMNNDEGIGDYERVLTLIDEVNVLQSDTSNDFEESTDAILLLYGMLNADAEDIERIKKDRILLLDSMSGQSAGWLTKEINDTALQSYKKTLDEAIHKFAKVPNLSDENFAGNISGEAMKFKLFATNQIIAQKQRKFKTALTQRLYLITKVMQLKAQTTGDYKDIQVNFNENTPYNELDNANLVKTLIDAGASRQLAFSKLRGVDDVSKELELQDKQKEPESAYFDM